MPEDTSWKTPRLLEEGGGSKAGGQRNLCFWQDVEDICLERNEKPVVPHHRRRQLCLFPRESCSLKDPLWRLSCSSLYKKLFHSVITSLLPERKVETFKRVRLQNLGTRCLMGIVKGGGINTPTETATLCRQAWEWTSQKWTESRYCRQATCRVPWIIISPHWFPPWLQPLNSLWKVSNAHQPELARELIKTLLGPRLGLSPSEIRKGRTLLPKPPVMARPPPVVPLPRPCPPLSSGAGEAGCGTASTLILVSPGELVSAPGPRGSGGEQGTHAARTYLQPGVPVAAAPSDGPVASAGRRQPYRSCIASEMPVRWHHPGA